MRWRLITIGIAVSLGLAGYVSDTRAIAVDQPVAPLATGGLISSLLAAPVVGQPYSAVQVHGNTRTLADGSTVSHRGHHSVYRDSEGRVHVEMRFAEGKNGAPDEVMVFVVDPVAHALTTWVAGSANAPKVATTIKLPASQQAGTPAENAAKAGRPQPVVTVEDLGTQIIQGLEVTGKRTTTTLPAGSVGNSAPIIRTHEVWTSPDLQLVIKQQWNDPRSGQRTVELEHIARANPDPSLFHAPAGYETKTASESLKELEDKLNAMQQ